jgi:hypothetical protein
MEKPLQGSDLLYQVAGGLGVVLGFAQNPTQEKVIKELIAKLSEALNKVEELEAWADEVSR